MKKYNLLIGIALLASLNASTPAGIDAAIDDSWTMEDHNRYVTLQNCQNGTPHYLIKSAPGKGGVYKVLQCEHWENFTEDEEQELNRLAEKLAAYQGKAEEQHEEKACLCAIF